MRLLRAIGSLFLVVAAGWTQSSALVLCIAPGGHVAIESGQERCVVPEGLGHRDEGHCPTGLAHTEACCTSCADLPLGSSGFVRPSSVKDDHWQPNIPAALPAAVTPSVSIARVADHSRHALLHGVAILSTPALQTVALRC